MARDQIIMNGRVWTAVPAHPVAEAVAISDGKIRFVGDEAGARSAVERDADVLDVGGRTVLPGLIDAHNHYLSTAEDLVSVNVRYPGVAAPADLTRLIAERAERTPDGQWIRAFGLDWAKFHDGAMPTRWDLDAATEVHPVVVYHVSGHHALVNSAALHSRGISENAPDPVAGAFVRDAAGRMTGVCLDSATNLILPVALDIGCHGPNFHTILPGEDSVALLEQASVAYLAAGLTTVCDPQVTRREMAVYRAARERHFLGVRVVMMPLSNHLEDFTNLGLAGPFGDDVLRIGAMKLYSDGTLIGGTAWFSEPYGVDGEFAGSTYWKPEELREIVGRAHAAGWQVGIHTGGDNAMQSTIDAIEGALRARPRMEARHRIEHCFYPTPAHIGRMSALGIVPVTQPNMLFDQGDEFVVRLGHRAHRLEPIREWLDAGIKPVLSSDAYVTSFNPFLTIANAMRRQTREGRDIGTDQRMTLSEALHAHTIDAAVALRMEDRIGSLERGKLADLTIVEGDLLAADATAVAATGVWMTMVGGETRWRASNEAA